MFRVMMITVIMMMMLDAVSEQLIDLRAQAGLYWSWLRRQLSHSESLATQTRLRLRVKAGALGLGGESCKLLTSHNCPSAALSLHNICSITPAYSVTQPMWVRSVESDATWSGSCQYANSSCPKLKCQVDIYGRDDFFLEHEVIWKINVKGELKSMVGNADKKGLSWGLKRVSPLSASFTIQCSWIRNTYLCWKMKMWSQIERGNFVKLGSRSFESQVRDLDLNTG